MRLGRSKRRGSVVKAPERGELIWLTFTPQSGREQAGRRPALVVSPSAYNTKAGLALVCPITSKVKGLIPSTHCSAGARVATARSAVEHCVGKRREELALADPKSPRPSQALVQLQPEPLPI